MSSPHTTLRFATPHGTFRHNIDTSQSIGQVLQLLHTDLKIQSSIDSPLGLVYDGKELDIRSKDVSESFLNTFHLSHGALIRVTYERGQSLLDVHQDNKSNERLQEKHDHIKRTNIIPIKTQMNSVPRIFRLDFKAGHYFQQYVRQNAWSAEHRVGWIYGTRRQVSQGLPLEKDADALEERYIDSRIYPQWDLTGSFIYEPLQRFDHDKKQLSILKEDTRGLLLHAEAIAAAAQMDRVGWVFSHDGKDRRAPLTALEVIRAAKLQYEYGDMYVTVTCSPTELGEAQFLCFSVTTQCVDLVVSGLLQPHATDPYKLQSLVPVDILKEESTTIDVSKFILKIAVEQAPPGLFDSTAFPVENRTHLPQSLEHLRDQVAKARRQNVRLFRDPHLLLFYLANGLLHRSELPGVLDAVERATKNNMAHMQELQSAESTIEAFSRMG